MGQAALSNEKQFAPFFCIYLKAPPQSSRTSPDLLEGTEKVPHPLQIAG